MKLKCAPEKAILVLLNGFLHLTRQNKMCMFTALKIFAFMFQKFGSIDNVKYWSIRALKKYCKYYKVDWSCYTQSTFKI